MHLYYVLDIKPHASIMACMLLWCMAWKWKHHTCVLLLSIGLCARASPAEEDEESGSELALLRNISPAQTDTTIDWIPALFVRIPRFVMLQSLSPGL